MTLSLSGTCISTMSSASNRAGIPNEFSATVNANLLFSKILSGSRE